MLQVGEELPLEQPLNFITPLMSKQNKKKTRMTKTKISSMNIRVVICSGCFYFYFHDLNVALKQVT
jgi:hypothetical protein